MLSWNCRGLGNPATVQKIKELHQQASLDIIFLMETKNSDSFVVKELDFLASDHRHLVPPERPNSGGLALYWKQDIDLQVLSSSKNVIDTIISHKGSSFFASFVYGHPDSAQRYTVWDQLISLAPTRDSAWILAGDFNEIIDNSEKSGGPERAEGSFGAFRNMLTSCDLFDLKHTGISLSWRGRRRTHLVYCRLDRVLINPAWSDSFPTGRCHYLNFDTSDHRPVVTVFDSAKRRTSRLFRYDRRLKDNIKVKELIAEVWNSDPSLSMDEKLSRCRKALCAWTRKQALNSKEAIGRLREKLDAAMVDPQGEDAVIASINTQLRTAYKEEEEFWRQRSRILWLSAGDRNSSFFHAVAKGRNARNRMSVIEDDDGKAYYEEEQIAAQISSYFANMFTSSGTGLVTDSTLITVHSAITPSISSETNAALCLIPEATEIKHALFLIHPDKAPGPDGFSASFFHSNWETIGSSLVTEVQTFFTSGVMPPATNVTYIRLIPKSTSAKIVADYRPIALCNVTYKVITKIISLRLKSTLQDIISDTQSAFVPGRAISDNVLITHEILHTLKSSEAVINCSMAVKTDMSKAYDRLEWSFIETVLLRFGFAPNLVNLIMQCISSVSYSFLVNDSVHERVIPSRGIRQGDPLSPYIFILCGEVLSGLCKRAQRSGHLSGLRVAIPAPRLNHLLFADDTMFFLNTDDVSCSTLVHILEQYKDSSDRIRIKAAAWSTRRLSSAGKLVMLQSVLTPIPSYASSCFLLPVSLCDRIQSALTRFWWDDSPEKRKMCWVSWDHITQPKALGGLGVRDIQLFNKALLAKLAWRIVTKPDSLLARVLKGKYCTKASFLQVSGTKTMSHGWRSIIVGRDLLVSSLSKVIGNGVDTKVWKDPWLSTTSPSTPIGPPTEENQDLVVSDFICRGTGTWNIARINATVPHLLHDILRIQPSITNAPDSYAWLASNSGSYSVKSGYYVAASMSQGEVNETTGEQQAANLKLNKAIWSCKTSPKLRLFLWKIIQGALPLGENLATRGMVSNISCIRCGLVETADHLFLHCTFTRQVWEANIWKQDFSPSRSPSFASALLEAADAVNLPPLGVKETLFPWILWGLWTARNYLIFENRTYEPAEILAKAIDNAREWSSAQMSLPNSVPESQRRLSPLLMPTTAPTCYTDAAWSSVTNRAGCGWYVEDSENNTILQGSTSFENISSAIMAEALAIRSALLQATSAGIQVLCIKSDCKALITALPSVCHLAGIYGIVRDIETLSFSFLRISFSYIPRTLNVKADSMAKTALYCSFPN